jgi:hypothetical protein
MAITRVKFPHVNTLCATECHHGRFGFNCPHARIAILPHRRGVSQDAERPTQAVFEIKQRRRTRGSVSKAKRRPRQQAEGGGPLTGFGIAAQGEGLTVYGFVANLVTEVPRGGQNWPSKLNGLKSVHQGVRRAHLRARRRRMQFGMMPCGQVQSPALRRGLACER